MFPTSAVKAHIDKKCGGPLTDPSYVALRAQDNAS